MKNYSSIEVIVPQPWRTVGLLCVFMFLLCIFFFIWQLFISSEPPDEEFIGVSYFGFFFTPFLLVYSLPLYLNCYPSWFVRLVGPQNIQRLIENAKRYLGQNQDNNPQLSGPKKWFENKRIFWLFVTGCGALGVFKGAGLL
jgi:hypothetical protein